MIYPRARLLWAALLILLPLAAVAGVRPEMLVVCVAGILVVAAVAAVDAALGFRRADSIRVKAPSAVRLTKDVAGEFPLEAEGHGRVSPAFPNSVTVEPAAAETGKTGPVFQCVARQRGTFRVDWCHLESRSPLGLWTAQTRQPLESEIRVYPNLRNDNTAARLLRRGPVGLHAQRMIGRGREFEKLREYMQGDSFDEINWKASARRGRPIVKVYQVERTQEVYVALDTSRLSARDGALERFVDAALVLGLAVERQGDLFGLITFSDRVHRFLRAKSGKSHYAMCREALRQVTPHRAPPDFEEIFSFLQLRLRRRALVIFLTSVDDPVLAEAFERDLRLVSRRHLVVAGVLRRPSVEPLFTGESPKDVDGVYERLAGHLMWNKLRELERALKRQGVPLAFLDPSRVNADLASLYLGIKRRQTL